MAESITRWRSKTNGFVYADEDNPLPVTGGGSGGGAVTIANGADVVEGTLGDTQVNGTVVGYAKSMWTNFFGTPVAIKVDGSGVTQPISAASLPLPSNAAQETGGNLATLAGAVTSSVFQENIAQIGGVAPNIGNGSTGTGTLRTAIANNSAAISVWGHGVTGAAVPANATQAGQRAATANPTAVTDGQLVGVMADKVGRTATVPFGVRDLAGDQTTSLSNTTSEITIVTAVASTFLDLLSLTCANTGATATEVSIRDTTGGSVRYTLYVPAGETRGIVFSSPLKQAAVNTNWTAQCANATTAMKISVQYTKNV